MSIESQHVIIILHNIIKRLQVFKLTEAYFLYAVGFLVVVINFKLIMTQELRSVLFYFHTRFNLAYYNLAIKCIQPCSIFIEFNTLADSIIQGLGPGLYKWRDN